ncbi:PAS domain-containing protein [Seonamhaeicola sp. NFXS20]|uniref:sensor histidine kinase n=1 Tax=Seonamhaeicola sp. NFXS20 TaxID=2816959 RepID=UPI003B8E5044
MKSHPLYLFFKKPIVAGVSVFLLLFIGTQFISYQQYLINENKQKKEIDSEINLIKERLQALVMYSYSVTKTLAYIVERNGIPKDFDEIAVELLERNHYFDVVELVDADGYITHVYPLKNNEVIGFNILASSTAKTGALTAIQRKDFFIAGPVNLKQGGVGIISRVPIFIDDKFFGFSAVVTKLSTFFNDLNINTSEDESFIYQLSRVNANTGVEEFFLETNMSNFKEFAVPIQMSIGEWKLYVVPIHNKINPAIWFAVFGFVIAIVGGWGVWYFAGHSVRLNRLINIKLKNQEVQLKSVYEASKYKIEQSEENLNKAQKIAKIGSWERDLKQNTLSWSKEMYRIVEKDPNEFKVTQSSFLDIVHPDDRELVLNQYKKALENKTYYQVIYKLLLNEKHIKYVSERGEIFYDSNNLPVKFFGTLQDITDRVLSEKELLNYKNNLEKLVDLRTEELNESKEALLNLLEDLNTQSIELEKEKVKAQSADLMKSAFLATMSHELRTPMNSIIGFTGILLKELAGPLNEEQKKQLNMVKKSGEHLLRLINDILDISKIEAGKLKISIYPFDYIETLKGTVSFLMPQAKAKNLSIETELPVSKLTITSDERRVEQVLLNLLSNAIKFSKKGIIQVKVHLKENEIVTEVIDQGMGISKKDLAKLFMPFIQLETGLSRNHDGTGLGLAISKNLIEKLGGSIQVESIEGNGSNFTFILPIENSYKNNSII